MQCAPVAEERPFFCKEAAIAQICSVSGCDGLPVWCRGRAWPRLLRGDWLLKKGCHRGEYADVLLDRKESCLCYSLQVLKVATSTVARAVWCGSGVIVAGKTEWHGAEVVHGLVCLEAIGCCSRGVTAS